MPNGKEWNIHLPLSMTNAVFPLLPWLAECGNDQTPNLWMKKKLHPLNLANKLSIVGGGKFDITFPKLPSALICLAVTMWLLSFL